MTKSLGVIWAWKIKSWRWSGLKPILNSLGVTRNKSQSWDILLGELILCGISVRFNASSVLTLCLTLKIRRGASVHLLMLSKMATGLFHRAITFATDAISEFWQFNRTNTEYLGYMADYFNCSLASTRAFADCLKKVDAESLAGYHTGVLVSTGWKFKLSGVSFLSSGYKH